MGKYHVYVHVTPCEKRYVGVTSLENPSDRWQNGLGYRNNKYFSQAIRKHGWNNIEHEILFSNLTEEEAYLKEVELIALYNTNDRRYGYNLTSGGERAKKHSEESKLKMRMNRRNLYKGERHHNYKRTLTEEERKIISLVNTGNKYCLGRKHTDETKRKMSLNHFNVSGENNPMYGKRHTKDTRIKISKNRVYTNGGNHHASKKVMQMTLNGDVVRLWDSCSTAMSEFRKKYSSSIKACCQGRTKTAYGYVWKYVD